MDKNFAQVSWVEISAVAQKYLNLVLRNRELLLAYASHQITGNNTPHDT